MKKIISLALIICFALAALVACSGDGRVTEGIPILDDIFSKKSNIPELYVIYGDDKYEAGRGTSSWHYPNADGTSTQLEMDSVSPLEAKDSMQKIEIVDDNTFAYFKFDTMPSKVTVHYWESWQDSYEDSLPLTAQKFDKKIDGAQFSIELETKSAIYEIVAEYTGEAGGTVRYRFYTE